MVEKCVQVDNLNLIERSFELADLNTGDGHSVGHEPHDILVQTRDTLWQRCFVLLLQLVLAVHLDEDRKVGVRKALGLVLAHHPIEGLGNRPGDW